MKKLKNVKKTKNLILNIKLSEIPMPQKKTKGAKYTPLSKRADKPNGIYWLIKIIQISRFKNMQNYWYN